MADHKLSNTIRNASAVNLRYSADLLNLGRDYLRAFTAALSQPEEEEQPTAAGSATARAAPARPTLLIAGHAGETANAAFTLNGSAKTAGKISLRVSGDFGDTKVTVDPETISLSGEGETIVRILAKIGKKMPADVDHVGSVTIPELDHQITQFVVRKLS